MQFLLLLIISVFASKEIDHIAEHSEPNSLENSAQNEILVKIEEDECIKKTSHYIGVIHNKRYGNWRVSRWSRNEKKAVYNGYYADEETAALASDTLMRQFIANGEKGHKLNFPDDDTEVFPEEKKTSSTYIGVSYIESTQRWRARRRGKNEKKMVYNGYYKDEVAAAHASDTLARKLMENGEKNHKLNFPDDETEVFPEETKTSKYIGVHYSGSHAKWLVQRFSKNENKPVYNGTYKDEETAAYASDTLVRKLMANGEHNHRLNFPDEETEVFPETKTSKYFGVYYKESKAIWTVQRWSKSENKLLSNGTYKDEVAAAHASDTLARKLMENGEKNHKLNFPDDNENQNNKRKRSKIETEDSKNK